MIRIYYKKSANEAFQIIDEPKEGCWIHVDNATTDDINQISQLIELNYTDIYDCLDKYEIPRIERIKEDVIIFTRHPAPLEENNGLYTTTFTIILTKNYVITVSPIRSLLVENFTAQGPRLLPSQKSKFLIYMLLKITQEYTLQTKKIRLSVLQQGKKMNQNQIATNDINYLILNEEVLNQYLSALKPMRKVLEAITSGRYTFLYEKDQDLLEDLLHASIQSEDLCTINLRSLRSLRDGCQIIFTNKLNRTIKLLTALTIILSIPTMIASLYGMNVALPLANAPFAFSGILLFIGIISFVSVFIFQRKRWL